MEFSADLVDLTNYEGFLKKFPKQAKFAMMFTLKAIGERAKANMIAEIKAHSIIRDEAFLNRAFIHKYPTTKNLVSTVGSNQKDRFTGWLEQEGEFPGQRTRFGTLASRGGDKNSKMKVGMRLKPGVSIPNDGDYQSTASMMAYLAAQGYKGAFKINRPYHPPRQYLRPGVYRFDRVQKNYVAKKTGKVIPSFRFVKALQYFAPPRKAPHTQWMEKAIAKTMSNDAIQREWAHQMCLQLATLHK